jgi:zinc-ribbon domain
VICPKCGEDNSDNFRFCGMCGNLLEARRPVSALMSNQASSLPRAVNAPVPRTAIEERAIWPANNKPAPPISGPSMLGLNQPAPSSLSPSPMESQPKPSVSSPQPRVSQPSADLLRDKSFSGLDSFFEHEQPKTGARRIILLVLLLAALGVAGWWAYGYLENPESRKSAATSPAAASNGGDVSANPRNDSMSSNSSNSTPPAADVQSEPKPAPTPEPSTPPAQSASNAVPEGPSENANPIGDVPSTTAEVPPKSGTKPTPVSPRTDRRAEIAERKAAEKKMAEKRQASVAAPKPAKAAQPAPTPNGDADFRKGEAYLYGRGVPENCDEAVKSLKAASAQQSAKARSAFGTMYATGHCVPRDLPTSYLWFAQALQLDPKNQILEKDLNAIWNQMTPPERQTATRMKQ